MAVSGSPVRSEPRCGVSPYLRLQLVLELPLTDGIGMPQVLLTGMSLAERHWTSLASAAAAASRAVWSPALVAVSGAAWSLAGFGAAACCCLEAFAATAPTA